MHICVSLLFRESFHSFSVVFQSSSSYRYRPCPTLHLSSASRSKMSFNFTNSTAAAATVAAKSLSASSITIGCFLAILGGCIASCANMLLKYTQLKMQIIPEDIRPHIMQTPQFWTVFFMYVFNAGADFAAYSFAPLSVVSPISGVVIIFNAFLANRIFGETLGMRDLVGSVLILVGGSVAVLFGSRQEPNRTVEELAALWIRPTFIIFASIQVFLLFALFVISRTLSPEWRGFRHWVLDAFCFEEQCHPSCLEPFQTDEATMEQYKVEQKIQFEARLGLNALCCALLPCFCGCWTNMLGKSVSEIVSQTVAGNNQFNNPVSYFMFAGICFMAIFQLRFITQMLRTFEAVLIVPLYQCSFTIFLIVFGLIFFEEFEAMTASDIGGFCGATFVCCIGIAILSARPVPTDEEMARAIGAVQSNADAPADQAASDQADGKSVEMSSEVAVTDVKVADVKTDGAAPASSSQDVIASAMQAANDAVLSMSGGAAEFGGVELTDLAVSVQDETTAPDRG